MVFGSKPAWRKTGYAALMVAGGAGLFWLATPWSLASLKTHNPASTRMMEFRRQQARAHHRRYQVRQHWVALNRISPWLQKAVLIAEDDTFYEHGALDFDGLWESLKINWRRKRYAQGGSTVTQQVAKNLFLSPRKVLLRKIKEAVLAVRLERLLTKKRILEIYLNVAEWGPGIFGAEEAARIYYGKSAADLNLDEAIALAAVLPSPLRHSPARADRYVQWRKAWILSRLQRWGGIPKTPAPAAPATGEPDWVEAEEADVEAPETAAAGPVVPDASGASPAASAEAPGGPLPATPTAF